MGGILSTGRRFFLGEHAVNLISQPRQEESAEVNLRIGKENLMLWKRTYLEKLRDGNIDDYINTLKEIFLHAVNMKRALHKNNRSPEGTDWMKYRHLLLDKSLVEQIMNRIPNFSHVRRELYLIHVLRVLLMCADVSISKHGLTQLRSLDSPDVIFTEAQLEYLFTLYASRSLNEAVVNVATSIFARLLCAVQYQETLLNLFSTIFPISFADEAWKYLRLHRKYAYTSIPRVRIMRRVNLLACIPNLLSYTIRAATVLLNVCRNLDYSYEPRDLEIRNLCLGKFGTLTFDIMECARVELKKVGVERLLRVAIFTMMACPQLREDLFSIVEELVILLFEGNYRESVMRKQYFLDWFIPGKPIDRNPIVLYTTSRIQSIQKAILDNSEVEDLRRVDMDLVFFSGPIRKRLNRFGDRALCYVPEEDCLELLNEYIASVPPDLPEKALWAQTLKRLISSFPTVNAD